MDNQTKNLFGQIQAAYTEAEADSGGGPIWPPDGEYDCYLDEVIVKSGEFRMKDATLPAVTVQFVYTLVDDPTRPEGHQLRFPGAAFDLPTDPTAIPNEGNMKRYEISLSRLKGFLQILLGRPSVDLPSDLEAIQAGCSGENGIICKVKVITNARGYHTDYLKELVSGAFPVNA